MTKTRKYVDGVAIGIPIKHMKRAQPVTTHSVIAALNKLKAKGLAGSTMGILIELGVDVTGCSGKLLKDWPTVPHNAYSRARTILKKLRQEGKVTEAKDGHLFVYMPL